MSAIIFPPMGMRTGILQGLRAERTPVALLAALALVFNLLASFAATADEPGAPAGFVICSAAGTEGLPAADGAPPHGGDFCPCGAACVHLACSAAMFAPSGGVTAVYSPAPLKTFLPWRTRGVAAEISFFTQGIRAPPLS